MKMFLVFVMLMLVGGGALYAKGKVIKTEDGFKIKQTHTYYESKITWGDGYSDHVSDTPITGIAVLAIGEGWTYSAVTDETGKFTIKVKAGTPFKIRVSDGNTWVDYDTELAGVQEGTTFSELN